MKRKTQKETEITKLITMQLEERGFIIKRIYNGGIPGGINPVTHQIRYRKKNPKDAGTPDLLAYNLKKKLFLFIEVKSAVGTASPDQKDFNKNFNSCHHFHALFARSPDDILKFLQLYGTIHRG